MITYLTQIETLRDEDRVQLGERVAAFSVDKCVKKVEYYIIDTKIDGIAKHMAYVYYTTPTPPINTVIEVETATTYTIKYGYLYNWYAINNPGFAPVGWHVPSDDEWTTLVTFLDGESVAGGKLKEAGFTHWSNPNSGADNSSNFTSLPGGYRYYLDGTFSYLGRHGSWWSSSASDVANAWRWHMNHNTSLISRSNPDKSFGFSVRLVADVTVDWIDGDIVTDYDENEYTVVIIGTQAWLQQNWSCTKLNNGIPLTEVTSNFSWSFLTTEGYCSYDNDATNVREIISTSKTLTGTITSPIYIEITESGVYYNTVNVFTDSTPKFSTPIIYGEYSIDSSVLVASTLYYFKPYIVSCLGKTYSDIITLTTT